MLPAELTCGLKKKRKFCPVFNSSYTTASKLQACQCLARGRVRPLTEVYCTFSPAVRGLTEGKLDPHRVRCVYRAFGGRSLFPSTVRSLIPVALKACLKVDLTEAPSNAGTFHTSTSPSFSGSRCCNASCAESP